MSNEWLQNLKPGDAVCVEGRNYVSISTVERTTKTQIILDKNMRFNRTSGYLVGGGTWDTTRLIKATEKRMNHIFEARHKSKLKDQAIKGINTATVDQLERVVAIFGEDKPYE